MSHVCTSLVLRTYDSMRVTYDSICNICNVRVNHIISHVTRVHESCLTRTFRRGSDCGSAVASLTVTGHTHIHTHTQTIHTRTLALTHTLSRTYTHRRGSNRGSAVTSVPATSRAAFVP